MIPPLCDCHGEPMIHESIRAHSWWRCVVKKREKDRRRYARDPARKRAVCDKYLATPAGRRARMRSRLNRDIRRVEAAINQLED